MGAAVAPVDGRSLSLSPHGVLTQLGSLASSVGQYFIDWYYSERYDVLWDKEFMKVGPERFYDFAVWKLRIPVRGFLRKGFILLSSNPLYRLVMILFIFIHTCSLLVQEPNVPREASSAPATMSFAIVVDRFLLFVFSVDFLVSLTAHCPDRLVRNPFLLLDLVVLIASFILEVADPIGQTIRFAFALNALRPFRVVRRLQSMRNIILVIVRSSKTMFDVLLLVLYLVVLFAFFALVLFPQGMHVRCHLNADDPTSAPTTTATTAPATTTTTLATTATTVPNETSAWPVPWEDTIPPPSLDEWGTLCNKLDFSTGFDNQFTGCDAGYSCKSGSPEVTDYSGYDNAGLAMLMIVQFFTLENWSTSALEVMDGFTMFSALFFIAATATGSFWALNLVLATITDAFSRFYADEEQRIREEAELKAQQTSNPWASDPDDTQITDEGKLSERLLRDHDVLLGTVAGEGSDGDDASATSLRDANSGVSALLLSELRPEVRRAILDQEDVAQRIGEAALEGRVFSIQDHLASTKGAAFGGGAAAQRGSHSAASRKHKRSVVSTTAGLSAQTASGEDAVAAKQLEAAIANNPLLRSRWRAMIAQLSRDSQLSLAHGIRSVDTKEITRGVLGRRQEEDVLDKDSNRIQTTDTELDKIFDVEGSNIGESPVDRLPGPKRGRPPAFDGLEIRRTSSPTSSPTKRYTVRVSSWAMDDTDNSGSEMEPFAEWMQPANSTAVVDMNSPVRGQFNESVGAWSPSLLAGSFTFNGGEVSFRSALKRPDSPRARRSVRFQTHSVWDHGEGGGGQQTHESFQRGDPQDGPPTSPTSAVSQVRHTSSLRLPENALSPLRKPRKSPFLTDEDERLVRALTAGRRLLPKRMGAVNMDSLEDGSVFQPDDDDVEVCSMRRHTFYEERVFDADKVRSYFPDFTPYPHQAMSGARNAHSLLSVQERPAELVKFESRNKHYTSILSWRQELDFDTLCPDDRAAWLEEGETLRQCTIPISSAEEYSTLLIPTLLDAQYQSSSSGSDSGDSAEGEGSRALRSQEAKAASGADDETAARLRTLRKSEGRKRSLAALDPHLTEEGRSTINQLRRRRAGDEERGNDSNGSIMGSLSSDNRVQPVNLHKRAERLQRLHQQLVKTARGIKDDKEKEFLANKKRIEREAKAEAKNSNNTAATVLGGRFGTQRLINAARQGGSHLRQVSKIHRRLGGKKKETTVGSTQFTDMDRNSDDSELSDLIHRFEVREAEREEQAMKLTRDPNVIRGTGKKRSTSGTKVSLRDEVKHLVDLPGTYSAMMGDATGDMGLFLRIARMQEDALEVRALERLIVKHWTDKMQLQEGQGARQVKRQARRGVRINQRKAIPPQGRLWLVLRGNRYRRLFQGLVVTNFILLMTSHAGEPSALTETINVYCAIVDVFMLADCVARVVLMGLVKYASVTTQNFYAFFEHIVAWFALIDLVMVATDLVPIARAFRVVRIFRFMKDWTVMRQIINHVRSSIRYLLNLLLLLGIFTLVFTVSGWHIFSGQAPGMEFMTTCSDYGERECISQDNCIWVTEYQWMRGDNAIYDVMKAAAQEYFRVQDDVNKHYVMRRNRTFTVTPSLVTDNPTTVTELVSLPPGYDPQLFDSAANAGPFSCRQYAGWGDLGSDQRFTFRNFISGFLTVFTIITKDNWVDVTHHHMEFISPWSVIFFFAILALMGYILTPLLVAILLVNFGNESTEEELKVIPDAVLLDEAMLSAELMSKELAEIGKRLRLKDEDKREKARMKRALQNANDERRIQRAKMDGEKGRKPQLMPAAKPLKSVATDSAKAAPNEQPFDPANIPEKTEEYSAHDSLECVRWLRGTASALQARRTQLQAWIRLQTRRRTLPVRFVSSVARYVGEFCDRRDSAPAEPLQGRSLYLFAADSSIRTFACRLVGGQYFGFERAVFWLSVVHCVVTPINEASVNDSSTLLFLDILGFICVVLSLLEVLMRCVAFGGFLGEYTYLMEDAHRIENRFDVAALCCSWLSAVLYAASPPSQAVVSIGIALGAFRPLRIVVRSTPTTMVCQAVWFSLPAMLNVLAVLMGATVIAGVVGVEVFKGRFRLCSDGSDRTKSECTGLWWAGPTDTVYFANTSQTSGLAPRVWRNPGDFSFDNVFEAFTSLVQIAVGSQWSDAMFSAMDGPESDGGRPERDQNVEAAAYFVVWVVFANFFLLNIFMGTVVDSYRRLRSKLSGDRSEADANENVIRKILDTKAKKTLSVPKIPFYSAWMNEVCFAIISSWAWSAMTLVLSVANVAVLLTIYYNESSAWSIAQFWANFSLGMVLLVEVVLKVGIAGPGPFFEMGFNKLLTCILLLQFVELIVYASSETYRGYQWLRVTWILRIAMVARDVRGVRKNLKIGLKSLPAMANIGSLLILVFYMFAILGMACFGHVRMEATSRNFLSKNLNFKTFPRAMFTLYRIATMDDYGDVVSFCGVSEPDCSNVVGNCGNHTLSRIFFTLFVILMTFVILNLFIAVVLENFEESVLIPLELQDRQSDVEKFRLVWSKMDPSGINVIAARDFVPLLQQLPGPRARLQELQVRKRDFEEFDVSDEQMERLAAKYAFGLRGEDSRSYIASLKQLQVPISIQFAPDGRAQCHVLFNDALNVIGELLFHRKLTDERTQELETALKDEATEYDLDYYVHHHYCVQVIQTWWKDRLDTVNRYATWSRFLAPLLKQLYDRNAVAVLGGGEDAGSGEKRNQMKTYGLVDLLKEVMVNPDDTAEEDTSWKHAILFAQSEGEGTSSEEEDPYLVTSQGAAPSSVKRDRYYVPHVGEAKWALGTEEHPSRPSRFIPTSERMAEVQRLADEAERIPRRHGQLNGTLHMPTVDDLVAKRRRDKEKWAKSGLPPSMQPKSAYQQQKTTRPPRILSVDEAEPPEVWRAKLGYHNAEVPAAKGNASASIMSALKEARRQGLIGGGDARKNNQQRNPAVKVDPVEAALQRKREDEYLRRRETKVKIRSALLAFARRVKENRAVEEEMRRPMFDEDATDHTYVPPTLDAIIRERRALGAQAFDETSEDYSRRKEQATLSRLFGAEAKDIQKALREEEREATRPRSMAELFPNSLIAARGHTWATPSQKPNETPQRLVPLPTSSQQTFLLIPDSIKRADGPAQPPGALSPSSGSSAGGGRKRGSSSHGTLKSAKSSAFGQNDRNKGPVIKPGSEQHELDRLLGVLVLKKFARRWRERASRTAEAQTFSAYLRSSHPSSAATKAPPIDPTDL